MFLRKNRKNYSVNYHKVHTLIRLLLMVSFTGKTKMLISLCIYAILCLLVQKECFSHDVAQLVLYL